ncbi:MAG: phycobilisome rod-core linker polypeptide [Cyanobacteria bacterium P01_A01_bin.135]
MALPLLNYTPSSQNQRVEGYEVPGDEEPMGVKPQSDIDALIDSAYRQIFFYAFKHDREKVLESQLRNGQITIRDFIRGLLLSETYRNSFYEKNNNYRFVEQCIQRVLGRDPYNEREKIAWSIVIGTKGLQGFVDQLLESDEYMENFGYNIVPFQRRRILPGRAEGERPVNIKSPRYDADYRDKMGLAQIVWQNQIKRFTPQEKQATAGNPELYLSMARSLGAQNNKTPNVSTSNMDYMSKVPRR